MASHELPANHNTVRVGVIDASFPPVLTICDGDHVTMQTWSHWAGQVVPGMSLQNVLALRDDAPLGPHSITGPIEMVGAEPGDVLRVEVLELLVGEWGFNLALPMPLGRGVLADQFPDGALRHLRLNRDTMTTELLAGIPLPLNPFLGIMGVAHRTTGRIHRYRPALSAATWTCATSSSDHHFFFQFFDRALGSTLATATPPRATAK